MVGGLLRIVALFALVGLAGCVPPGARPAANAPSTPPPSPEAPRLAIDLTGLSDLPPAWEARSVTPNATIVIGRTYNVRAGETLRGVASGTGAGTDAIARANGLKAPFILAPGRTLTIPGGRYHEVRSGETGIAIARAYAIPWRQIVAANGLAEPFVLRAGQRLLLPGAIPPPTPSSAQSIAARAAAFRIDIDDIMTGGEPATQTAEVPVIRTTPSSPTTFTPTRFLWPAGGRVVGRFGPQGSGRISQGIDIAAVAGAPILAASSGTIAYVGNAVPGYGGLILIRHDDNWFTAYGHAQSAFVKKGDVVKSGQSIGSVGDDAPLHFEVRRARKPVDPLSYLPKR